MGQPTPKALLRLEQVSLFASLKTQKKGEQLGYPILQDISFEVFEGDRIAITGSSGAGKSYLLRVLNRLSEYSNGKIYLENQEYRQIPALQLRSSVTLVPQESKLLGMSVKEALAYPLVLRGLSKQIVQQRVTYWIEQLQIPDDWLGRAEVQLSAGQRQLVAIARALVIQPKILLLDEPTSALDAGKAEHLIQILCQLAQNQQTTVLMVNHQLDLCQEFCTCLLYLQQGRLISNQKVPHINWANVKENLIKAKAQDEFEF
ncbi:MULTISPECIES: ABC transporter ATP-binding protein [Nostocales]|uniref:ATP-binding cassette domain-containing protein n=3 Tax=Nostocales TaxID=1161 RepID=A0A0C1N6M4_9CYAN|nr:ATP-binding cassette domain-containing protein [Tolypothrix bouteillei]KAF3891182.1 ATP-binding cassette domain-containing protein [Tolypothrix bouteillei VB521301]